MVRVLLTGTVNVRTDQTSIRLGNNRPANAALDGRIQEVIHWPSEQTQRTAIESNINTYFSITNECSGVPSDRCGRVGADSDWFTFRNWAFPSLRYTGYLTFRDTPRVWASPVSTSERHVWAPLDGPLRPPVRKGVWRPRLHHLCCIGLEPSPRDPDPLRALDCAVAGHPRGGPLPQSVPSLLLIRKMRLNYLYRDNKHEQYWIYWDEPNWDNNASWTAPSPCSKSSLSEEPSSESTSN